MNRRAAIAIVSAAAALLLIVTVWWWLSGEPEPAVDEAGPPEAVPVVGEEEDFAVDLYFPGSGGRLYAERRPVPESDDPVEQISHILNALLSGPQHESLRPPLPAGVMLGGVDLAEDGVVYVDLRSPEGTPPPPSGSRREMLMVYSVVDSVTLNLPDVRRVGLLWNGRQQTTFAGHIDTTRPLGPDTSLVARLR